ncbi:MAG TPA: S9 family peptidase [Thermomicrobiales bacterium]|nr:S9 family peptidase [Thermomicrobiales bacterium]
MSDTRPNPRPLTAEDLYRIHVVSDPQAAPDGSRIAWVDSVMDKTSDSYRSCIMVSRPDGGDAYKVTSGVHRDSAPRWSPDGTMLVFESNRPSILDPENGTAPSEAADAEKAPEPKSGKDGRPPAKTVTQLWTIRVEGGEARQLTRHPSGAASATWSPDGAQVAFVASDHLDKDAAEPPPVRNGDVADERIIHRMHYRGDGQGFIDKVPHLWTVRLDDRTTRQMTAGDAGVSEPAWSPDGRKIAFVSNRSANRKRFWTRSAIHVLDIDSGEITTITEEDARFGSPRWSPAGDRIAFVGHLDAANGALNDRIWTAAPDGSGARSHTDTWDVSAESTGMSDLANTSQGGPVWLGNRHILTVAAERGAARVFMVDLAGGTPVALTEGPHVVSGFTVAGDRLIYLQGSIDRPAALYSSALDVGDPRPVADPNRAILAEVALHPAIDLTITSPDKQEIQGWLLTPAGYSEGSGVKHRLIVQIHGGPHSMYGYAMFHEMQLMAARGYAVVFTNPRGSGGYGEAFTGSTRGRWGESDMPDVIAAVDQVSALPWIDTERIGITGGSYGGYLTNWIIGHDDRFKAAVTQRCVSNFHSFFGTSDIGSTFGAFEFDGVPWKDAEKLLRYSPISYVDSITTPLLILHSEQDHRCPIEQAEQLYTALSYLEREVAFIRFPEEGHELSRSGTPSRRLARLHHLIGWFDSHL